MFKRWNEIIDEKDPEKKEVLDVAYNIKSNTIRMLLYAVIIITYVIFGDFSLNGWREWGCIIVNIGLFISCGYFGLQLVKNLRNNILIDKRNMIIVRYLSGSFEWSTTLLLIIAIFGRHDDHVIWIWPIIGMYGFVSVLFGLFTILLKRAIFLREEQDLTI